MERDGCGLRRRLFRGGRGASLVRRSPLASNSAVVGRLREHPVFHLAPDALSLRTVPSPAHARPPSRRAQSRVHHRSAPSIAFFSSILCHLSMQNHGIHRRRHRSTEACGQADPKGIHALPYHVLHGRDKYSYASVLAREPWRSQYHVPSCLTCAFPRARIYFILTCLFLDGDSERTSAWWS